MHNQQWAQLVNDTQIQITRWREAWAALPFLLLACFYVGAQPKQETPRLVWGSMAIINNRYWSEAMKKVGYESTTLMTSYAASINKKTDYDRYTDELVADQQEVLAFLKKMLPQMHQHMKYYVKDDKLKRWGLKRWIKGLGKRLEKMEAKLAADPTEYAFDFAYDYYVFLYTLLHYDIYHHSFLGGYLLYTALAPFEAFFLKLAGKKVVTLPFGGDSQQYSTYTDNIFKHTLLADYPLLARQETTIRKRVEYWTREADAMVVGFGTDGFGRWDVFPYSTLTIDTELWQPREHYTYHDGVNGPVKVIHTPNHRGVKGTEYILRMIDELKAEGLQIELILMERLQNDEVRRLMAEEADILVEQLIRGYALSGVEGMASGLPVITRLGDDYNTQAFRHYSYLNECPVVSSSVETFKDDLRALVMNPALREQLGRAGRAYVEKYHHQETAQYLFGSIYDKIWRDQPVDLIQLFNPLTSEFNHRKPMVTHPLVQNRIPATFLRHPSGPMTEGAEPDVVLTP